MKKYGNMVATFGSKGSPTKQEFIFELLFFLAPLKTLVVLRSTRMGVVKGVVATLPFSKTSFSENMQPRIFFLMYLPWQIYCNRWFLFRENLGTPVIISDITNCQELISDKNKCY